MKKIILIYTLVVLGMACQPEDPLLATWKIVRVSYTPSGMATPEALRQGMQWEEISAGFRNSTFALYENNYSAFFSTRTPFRQGRWAVKDDVLILILGESARPYQFLISDQNEQNLILTLMDDNLIDGTLTLHCQKSDQYIHDGVDLLAPEQNSWRKKAEKKETKEEIKARVVAHLDYLITYFEGIEEKKQTYFETGLVSSPFRFYAHGLGLNRDSRYARQWQASFHDEADAAVAFELLKNSLQSVKKFPRATTFTQEYLLAFQQMRRYFDQ
jgi:hypothetical protein